MNSNFHLHFFHQKAKNYKGGAMPIYMHTGNNKLTHNNLAKRVLFLK
jgi:hypothetical protein